MLIDREVCLGVGLVIPTEQVDAVGGHGLTEASAWWVPRGGSSIGTASTVRESSVGYLLSVKRTWKARIVTERMAKLLRRA